MWKMTVTFKNSPNHEAMYTTTDGALALAEGLMKKDIGVVSVHIERA